jgi:hypothetical protein
MNQTDPLIKPINTKALGNTVAALLDAPTRIAATLAGAAIKRASGGCCEVPPPCWEPRPAGTCCLDLAPGTQGIIRVHVMNCGWQPQIVVITALGKLAGFLSFVPTTITLHPQESGMMVVVVNVPATLKPGQRVSGPVIIRGCVDHFFRLDLTVSDCTTKKDCDVVINDCQDQVHHWYDHFYCPRPCSNPRNPYTRG